MANLTANQESFIQLMTKSAEHARRGFELLLARPSFEAYFDVLAAAGLFNPSQNPMPVPASEPGYFRIPYWDALNYLEAVAKLAGERNDLQLAEKVMQVVRTVSVAREEDGSIRENYHTYRKFAEILGLVPTLAVTFEDVDLVAGWLGGKFDRGMVGHALGTGALPRLLASESRDDWQKACRIVEHCTALQRIDDKGVDGRKKFTTVIEDHWLKELVDRNAKRLGCRTGEAAAGIFLRRLREVFARDGREAHSWLSRPAIEEHDQNHAWDGPENRFVEGLRDVLLSWVDCDLPAARLYLGTLLRDQAEIVRRIAIYILGQRWGSLRDLYGPVIGAKLLDAGHVHELYGLLRDRFQEFSEPERVATVEAISQIPRPANGEEPELRLRYVQRNWLSAIVGKGSQRADEWFRELNSDERLGAVPEHPDFNMYMESLRGPSPSPYSVQELLAFAQDGSLIETLNGFIPSNSWQGSNTGALVEAVAAAVELQPATFLPLIPAFLNAKRPFQFGLISGFKRCWDSAKDGQSAFSWDRAWHELVGFFEQLVGDPTFWTELVVEERDLTPNRNWIAPAIADFLHSGTRNDERAYNPELLARTYSVIHILLRNAESVESADEADAMTQAINSAKGKAVEALFSHSLRACRLADRAVGSHEEAWSTLRPAFDSELAKCKNANYEFSTLAGAYVANISYLSPEWLRENVQSIFPREFASNRACALNGLGYAPSSRPVYMLLVEKGIIDAALRLKLEGRQTREKLVQRIALAYLMGDETLDSPRFAHLFEAGLVEDLQEASNLFWSCSNQNLSDAQVARIVSFWDKCVRWSRTAPEPPARLLSELSRLSCYLKAVGAQELELLRAVAPFVNAGYNADAFVEQLGRLADGSPAETSAVLGQVLSNYEPTFDFEDKLKALLRKLAERGMKADAIAYAERLRQLPGMHQLFIELTNT